MFPRTRHSVVQATSDPDPAVRRGALETLVSGYWKPVYKYLRFRWRLSPEDAEDATQGFFTAAVEKGWFAGFDPARARFRTYLRTCLDRYVGNERKTAGRLKRGGGADQISIDVIEAERELGLQDPSAAADPEAYFEREWVRALFGTAVARLRERYAATRQVRLRLFEQYDLATVEDDARPSYQDLADQHGLAVHDVTNHLAAARRDFRAIVIELLAVTAASDEDARAEARAIFGER